MRIIKFRGKCAKDSRYSGEWVYGACVQCEKSNDVLIIYAINDRNSCSYHVDPDTVGQFTGLYDKNGEEIYEGDILALQETDNKVTHCPVSMNCKGYWSIDFGINYGAYLGLVDKKRVEVIGNIHDNPELLEGGGE